MNESTTTPQQPSGWTRFWRFLVRLLLVVVIGIIIGVALYWTVPALYRQFILPVQEHQLRLDSLEAKHTMYVQQTNEKLTNLQTRLQSLETQQDADKANIATLNDRLDDVEAALATQQAHLDADLTSQQSLADEFTAFKSELSDFQVQAQDDLDALQEAEKTIQASLKEISTNQIQFEENLQILETQVSDLSLIVYQEDDRWTVVQMDIEMVKVMELLTRARAYLVQNNLTLAQASIEAGRSLLIQVQLEAPEYQPEIITEIITQLDEALVALPRFPVRAADHLETAWQLILEGLPSSLPESNPTSTPTATPSPVN
jgi:hypothetical protein